MDSDCLSLLEILCPRRLREVILIESALTGHAILRDDQMHTVSGPFLPQLLSDRLLVGYHTFNDSRLSSSTVCKTTAALCSVDVHQLRAQRASQTPQFPMSEGPQAPQRDAGECHSFLKQTQL